VFTLSYIIMILWSVTTDGFWINDRSYWTFRYNAYLHYIVHYYTHTHTHTPVSTATSSLPLLGSGFLRRTFPFLCVSELSTASATRFNSNSSQRLNLNSPLTNPLTNCNRVRGRVRVRITLRLAVYLQSPRLGAGPLEAHDQRIFFSWTLAAIVLM
jgi:hypothetical protein